MGVSIAAFGSHSALQILHGAKLEGFHAICICIKGAEKPYKSFKVADEIISIDSYKDYFDIENELIKRNAILVPHASMISYLGNDSIDLIRANYFGDRKILRIEADREKQKEWLLSAGLKVPDVYTPETIQGPCIVKSHGAAGGRGYFIVNSKEEFEKKKLSGAVKGPVMIQQYIVGVPFYMHFFYSPIEDEVELMGFDKRYESNVDGIGRIHARDQVNIGFEPNFTVVGNHSLVIRESLLPKVFGMGEAVVEAAKKYGVKMIGPFCLETVIDPDMNIYVFEISARIVAGTNVSMNGSKYSHIRYNKPVSTGRRIAMEIKSGIETKNLNKMLG